MLDSQKLVGCGPVQPMRWLSLYSSSHERMLLSNVNTVQGRHHPWGQMDIFPPLVWIGNILIISKTNLKKFLHCLLNFKTLAISIPATNAPVAILARTSITCEQPVFGSLAQICPGIKYLTRLVEPTRDCVQSLTWPSQKCMLSLTKKKSWWTWWPDPKTYQNRDPNRKNTNLPNSWPNSKNTPNYQQIHDPTRKPAMKFMTRPAKTSQICDPTSVYSRLMEKYVALIWRACDDLRMITSANACHIRMYPILYILLDEIAGVP